MKRFAIAGVLVVLASSSAHAACHSDACTRAMAWKSGYTAIVLDETISRHDYLAVLNAITTNGGAVAIESERVLLGWIPKTAARELRAVRGVRQIAHTATVPFSDLADQDDSLAALRFFNRVVSGDYEDEVERGLATAAEPLVNCVQARPPAGPVAPDFDFRTPFQIRPCAEE